MGGANNVPPQNVKYSGLAPQQVGVWQINVQIPNDAVSLENSPTQVLIQVDSLPSGGGAPIIGGGGIGAAGEISGIAVRSSVANVSSVCTWASDKHP